MATVGKTPQNSGSPSGEQPLSKEQLRKDRINLVLVVVVFAVLIGLMIWLASMGPSTGSIRLHLPDGAVEKALAQKGRRRDAIGVFRLTSVAGAV